MKVMVLVKATPETEQSGATPDNEMMEAMGRYNEELVNAGVMIAGEGLRDSSYGARVQFDGADVRVVDGPFTESKELLAGFWIWEVKSFEEAVEWAKRCPRADDETSELELRQVFELEDFTDATPQIVERETRLRDQLEGA
ncbi:hypothetical protein CLV56_1792 [Mumia flava]|uniref:YCII-related domain-containing protein n=1 Tax=Mumia flava TaxID=1348852 RepID=A0A0B2B7Z3_9ACTN|nr:YciI family protein [Mumia flava]PJJ57557.1 hypothetical protein CLV56_1792 [Mumia flava]